MKDISKVIDTLGPDTIEEMDSFEEGELRNVIVQANGSMQQVADELAENEKYQEILRMKSAAEVGKREVDKRQKARIKYALHRLDEIGRPVTMEAKAQTEMFEEHA